MNLLGFLGRLGIPALFLAASCWDDSLAQWFQHYTYVAVFEVADRNIKSAKISVLSPGDQVSRPFNVTGGLASYAFVGVELKPAHYTAVNIAAEPGANTGRIHLHGYRLYAIPKKGDLTS